MTGRVARLNGLGSATLGGILNSSAAIPVTVAVLSSGLASKRGARKHRNSCLLVDGVVFVLRLLADFFMDLNHEDKRGVGFVHGDRSWPWSSPCLSHIIVAGVRNDEWRGGSSSRAAQFGLTDGRGVGTVGIWTPVSGFASCSQGRSNIEVMYLTHLAGEVELAGRTPFSSNGPRG